MSRCLAGARFCRDPLGLSMPMCARPSFRRGWLRRVGEVPEPILAPGMGWAQGAAGIAAFLFGLSRLLDDGPAAAASPAPGDLLASLAGPSSGDRP
jgi:hypothetical protein